MENAKSLPIADNQNPCDDIPKDEWLKPNYQHYPIWEEKDLQKFLKILEKLPETPRNIKHKTFIYISLISGARKGEVSALTEKTNEDDEEPL